MRRSSARRSVRDLWATEEELRQQGFVHVAGVDEAGRGPLAGPVVAAAVILPARRCLPGLADSKAVAPAKRQRLFDLIGDRAVCMGVGIADVRTIDRENIRGATHLAMRRAIGDLDPPADFLLVDGLGLPGAMTPQLAVVGGDGLCASVAAASIVAKVVRDRMMAEIHERYPGYGFVDHKGYPTRAHLDRLRELGPCPEHRTTFAPVRAALQSRLPLGRYDGCAP